MLVNKLMMILNVSLYIDVYVIMLVNILIILIYCKFIYDCLWYIVSLFINWKYLNFYILWFIFWLVELKINLLLLKKYCF